MKKRSFCWLLVFLGFCLIGKAGFADGFSENPADRGDPDPIINSENDLPPVETVEIIGKILDGIQRIGLSESNEGKKGKDGRSLAELLTRLTFPESEPKTMPAGSDWVWIKFLLYSPADSRYQAVIALQRLAEARQISRRAALALERMAQTSNDRALPGFLNDIVSRANRTGLADDPERKSGAGLIPNQLAVELPVLVAGFKYVDKDWPNLVVPEGVLTPLIGELEQLRRQDLPQALIAAKVIHSLLMLRMLRVRDIESKSMDALLAGIARLGLALLLPADAVPEQGRLDDTGWKEIERVGIENYILGLRLGGPETRAACFGALKILALKGLLDEQTIESLRFVRDGKESFSIPVAPWAGQIVALARSAETIEDAGAVEPPAPSPAATAPAEDHPDVRKQGPGWFLVSFLRQLGKRGSAALVKAAPTGDWGALPPPDPVAIHKNDMKLGDPQKAWGVAFRALDLAARSVPEHGLAADDLITILNTASNLPVEQQPRFFQLLQRALRQVPTSQQAGTVGAFNTIQKNPNQFLTGPDEMRTRVIEAMKGVFDKTFPLRVK